MKQDRAKYALRTVPAADLVGLVVIGRNGQPRRLLGLTQDGKAVLEATTSIDRGLSLIKRIGLRISMGWQW